jgi:hypothetical protein
MRHMTTSKIAYLPLLMGRIAKRGQNLTIFHWKWNNYLMNTLTIEIASKINCGILVEHIYLLWRERSTMCILDLWIVSSSWFPRKSIVCTMIQMAPSTNLLYSFRTGPVWLILVLFLSSHLGDISDIREYPILQENELVFWQMLRVVPIIIIKFLEMLRVCFSQITSRLKITLKGYISSKFL